MNWLRRLLGHDLARGTLTLLDDGQMIVGAPADWDLTQHEARRIKLQVDEWLANPGKPLVLPWPVDVPDTRTQNRRA